VVASIVGTQDFYSAAVQVIPVLALVQIVEGRNRQVSLPAWVDATLLWAMFAAVGTGEMVGLRVLYWGRGAHGDQWWVIAALVVSAAAAVVPAVWAPTIELFRHERWYARAPIAVPALAITWLVVAFLAVLHR
jgi:hypothetical protein